MNDKHESDTEGDRRKHIFWMAVVWALTPLVFWGWAIWFFFF
jgi:hypothetical protein